MNYDLYYSVMTLYRYEEYLSMQKLMTSLLPEPAFNNLPMPMNDWSFIDHYIQNKFAFVFAQIDIKTGFILG